MPTPPSPKDDELARRYGLEPVPESVQRLTQLVARRDSGGNDIANLVNQDRMLTGRLLSAANPRARNEAEYRYTTVEDSLARVGMNWVLMLAMVEPLLNAVHKTFSTMLSIDLKQTPVGQMTPFKGDHVIGEVAFNGKATGLVHLRLLPISARAIAMIMLGVKDEEVTGQAEIDDVIGELSNIIAGNLKSNLCDAKLDCKLEPPRIFRTSNFDSLKSNGNVSERFGFGAPELDLYVDISVNPTSA
jgi:chemotaxis protein CheX